MPYELTFNKLLNTEASAERYFNDCCVGGDTICDRLVPGIRAGSTDVRHNQEDWGWFLWFKRGTTEFAIDVFCDDPDRGAFRIWLTAHVRRRFWGQRVVDTAELDELKTWVIEQLRGWVDGPIATRRLSENHDPES